MALIKEKHALIRKPHSANRHRQALAAQPCAKKHEAQEMKGMNEDLMCLHKANQQMKDDVTKAVSKMNEDLITIEEYFEKDSHDENGSRFVKALRSSLSKAEVAKQAEKGPLEIFQQPLGRLKPALVYQKKQATAEQRRGYFWSGQAILIKDPKSKPRCCSGSKGKAKVPDNAHVYFHEDH